MTRLAAGTGAHIAEFLELPLARDGDAKRALRRGAARAMARVLRTQLGYPGAALALEMYAEDLRAPFDPGQFDDDPDTEIVIVIEAD